MQHGESSSQHKHVSLCSFTGCCVLSWWVTGAAFGHHLRLEARRQGLGSAPKSWRRLPKILFPPAPAYFATCTLQDNNMAKTKEKKLTNGGKRGLLNDDPFSTEKSSRPSKKAKLLDDSDNSDAEEGGATLKVNDEYAKRFEYNKKREEKHRRQWHKYRMLFRF
jgi:hypothetical protein